MFTTPLYLASTDDKEITDFFLLDQKMGPKLKLSMFSEVELQSMPSPTQSESINPMRSNAQLVV